MSTELRFDWDEETGLDRPPHAQRASLASMLGGRRRASAKREVRRWGAALVSAAALLALGCTRDGVVTGAKSGEPSSVEADERPPRVAGKGGEGSEVEVPAVAGKKTDVAPVIAKEGAERSNVPAFVIGGVGVASLIAGAVLMGVAESNGAALQANAPRDKDGGLLCWKAPAAGSTTKPECDTWRAKAAEAGALGNASIGLFVVAGVAAAGAATWWLWPSRSPASAQRLQVVPIASLDGGGALITGSF